MGLLCHSCLKSDLFFRLLVLFIFINIQIFLFISHKLYYGLFLFRDTTISTTAELTSKYHFAAHMGQLISGVDTNGCNYFYPQCPFPGLQVLQMMKKVRMR